MIRHTFITLLGSGQPHGRSRGQSHRVSGGEPMRRSNKLLVTCDGPSCESIPKRGAPTRSLLFSLFVIALAISLSSICAQSQPQNQLQERLQAIFQMSAEEMAATSAFTRRGYEAQLAYAYRIQNKQIRDIVLDFMLKPAATAFGQPATQSWLASPGSGWKSHHAYPGGLSIHNLEWVEVASAWVDTYEKVYGVKLDRDLVIAGLILHDWGKLWFLFDDGSGKIQEPEWYPKAWGTKAKWKWMGGHGTVLYAELIHRGAPKELLFAAASAHFDPHWGLETDGEGLNPAMSALSISNHDLSSALPIGLQSFRPRVPFCQSSQMPKVFNWSSRWVSRIVCSISAWLRRLAIRSGALAKATTSPAASATCFLSC